MSDPYTCTLNDACLQQAITELNEDPKNRISSVQTLRDWIQQQPHLICRTETAFLLKFLRTAKFSQLRARSMIEGYLGLKMEFPQFYCNWDPLEPQVAQFFKAGVMLPLPGYLNNGQKAVVFRYSALGEIFPKNIGRKFKDAMCRYWYMIMLHFSKDENVQVAGVVYILDYSNCPLRALTMFGLNETRDIMKYQGRVPGRFKGFWMLNEGTAADAIIAVFKPFLSKKTTDRMRFLGQNLELLYKRVPKTMLPEEYLPDDYDGLNGGSFKTLTEQFYSEITEPKSLEFLQIESDVKWQIDHSVKPVQPSASFRKLNID